MKCAHCARDLHVMDFMSRVGGYLLCAGCATVEALR